MSLFREDGMNWLETMLVTGGISLDIFATIACKGAQLSKIEKEPLIRLSLLFGVWQAVALYIGDVAGNLLYQHDSRQRAATTEILAMVIFVVMGIRMLYKAWKKETIPEHRDDVYAWKSLIGRLAVVSLGTLVVGIGLGFLGTHVGVLTIAVLLLTILVVITALYVGYHYGYEQKTKAYTIGGVLLMVGAMDTMFRYIMR